MNHTTREVATWTRWLHIYLSMFSFAVLLFFAVTGITLSHTEWIDGKQQTTQMEGKLNAAWLSVKAQKLEELKTVEYLRDLHHIKSPVKDFTIEDEEVTISFKGPGYAADCFIDRQTGEYKITVTESGLIALMNDLHKGRDTGRGWSRVIDASAVMMILVSFTGFMMIFFLKKKRLTGLLCALLGAIITLLGFYFTAI